MAGLRASFEIIFFVAAAFVAAGQADFNTGLAYFLCIIGILAQEFHSRCTDIRGIPAKLNTVKKSGSLFGGETGGEAAFAFGLTFVARPNAVGNSYIAIHICEYSSPRLDFVQSGKRLYVVEKISDITD
jgi:hypothetical protein